MADAAAPPRAAKRKQPTAESNPSASAAEESTKKNKDIAHDGDDPTAALMSSLSAQQIGALMSKEGPVVKVVVLNVDGSTSELDADMSPRKATPQDILGGAASFLGQFPQLNVIAMLRREAQAEAAGLAVNTHKLP